MATTPEKKVKDKVVKILKEFGAYWFYPVATGFGRSGVPDIVACYRGRFYGIEVKADAKKNPPTLLQTMNLEQINMQGGISMVLDENNFNSLRAVLGSAGGQNGN